MKKFIKTVVIIATICFYLGIAGMTFFGCWILAASFDESITVLNGFTMSAWLTLIMSPIVVAWNLIGLIATKGNFKKVHKVTWNLINNVPEKLKKFYDEMESDIPV